VKLRSLVALIFLFGCASAGREDRQELRKFFMTGAYESGFQFLEKSKYYQDEKEKLLMLMEKGILLHVKGDYEQSSLVLDQARSLSNQLYTTSASKKVQKIILNDSFDIFYGEVYERSMLYFYLSLNSILNYQKTKKRDDLFKARAEILGWDSFLASIKEDRLGKSVYKNDLLLKLYGAKIHEIVGTREDDQIAAVLYKDALNVLFKNYNTYPAFNTKYKDFKKDFEHLASMPFDDVKKKYVEESNLQAELRKYIEQSSERLKNRHKLGLQNTHVTLILQKGLIAEKVGEKSFYGLDFLAREPLVALYVADVLGLLPSPTTYNPGGAYVGILTASAALHNIGVGFELPKIVNNNKPTPLSLSVLDQNNKVVATSMVALVNPMGDIAEEAVYEQSSWLYARVGARLATKHATAILASFATYKALGGGGRENSFLARNAALLQYVGAAKVIEESERADTRYWSTLPNEIRLVDFDLPPGTYRLEATTNPLDPNQQIDLGTIAVEKQDSPLIINIRK
jgi:hypothetical protein